MVDHHIDFVGPIHVMKHGWKIQPNKNGGISSWESHLGVSMAMGVPQKWMVFVRENLTKMDDDWGCSHFRKPPSVNYVCSIDS